MAGTCRPQDLCGRVGGDESSVICAGVDLCRRRGTIAQRIAAAVTRALPRRPRRSGGARRLSGLVMSVSTGVSDMPGSSSSQDEIVGAGPTPALYAAKAATAPGSGARPPLRLACWTLRPPRKLRGSTARADRARHRGRARRPRDGATQKSLPPTTSADRAARPRRAPRPRRRREWPACSAPHSSTTRSSGSGAVRR